MKKSILVLIATLFATLAFAQTVDETIQWLTAKTPPMWRNSNWNLMFRSEEIIMPISMLNGDFSRVEVIMYKDITSTDLQYSDKFKILVISGKTKKYHYHWSKTKGDYIEDSERFEYYINLKTPDEDIKKFEKAIKHLAELKGAKLIKDNLFDE